jgi:hypothetical protein
VGLHPTNCAIDRCSYLLRLRYGLKVLSRPMPSERDHSAKAPLRHQPARALRIRFPRHRLAHSTQFTANSRSPPRKPLLYPSKLRATRGALWRTCCGLHKAPLASSKPLCARMASVLVTVSDASPCTHRTHARRRFGLHGRYRLALPAGRGCRPKYPTPPGASRCGTQPRFCPP